MAIQWTSERRKLKELKDYDKNPRKMDKKRFEKLVESIKSDGYHQRLLINSDGTIIGGHARKKALLKAGWTENQEIDVLMPNKQLEAEDFDRINIRDNLPYGEFDFDILANNFDQEQLIEWGMPEQWLNHSVESIDYSYNDENIPDFEDTTCKLGDIWSLGEHRLICGDARNMDLINTLLNGEQIDLCYTDPPYGIKIQHNDGRVGSGSVRKAYVYPKMKNDEDINLASDFVQSLQMIFISKCIPTLIIWGANNFCHMLQGSSAWIIWDKENTGDFADAELAWTNTSGAVRIFKHQWNGMIRESEKNDKRCHPTQKPIALAEWCFEKYAPDSKNVMDLFGGSGSTLLACEKTNRKCFMMEIEPYYCDVIIKRWEKLTGNKAKLIT